MRPVRVDNVGDRALRIAARSSVASRFPRVVVSPQVITQAAIDPRAAFLLSLIDGHSSLALIADLAGETLASVETRVDKLVRLGLVALDNGADADGDKEMK